MAATGTGASPCIKCGSGNTKRTTFRPPPPNRGMKTETKPAVFCRNCRFLREAPPATNQENQT